MQLYELLSSKIDEWWALMDIMIIDPYYTGQELSTTLVAMPEKKSYLVIGKYTLQALDGEGTILVKIPDILGEEILITPQVQGSV